MSGGFLNSGTMTKVSFRLNSLQPHDQRVKRSFLPFPIGKILRRHSDWLNLGHVPFPGPMAVVRGMGYYDWSDSESHVHLWSGGEGALREVC